MKKGEVLKIRRNYVSKEGKLYRIVAWVTQYKVAFCEVKLYANHYINGVQYYTKKRGPYLQVKSLNWFWENMETLTKEKAAKIYFKENPIEE